MTALLPVEGGGGGPALAPQGEDAPEFGLGLLERRGRRPHLSFGLFALEAQVGCVEGSQRLAHLDRITDTDEALGHLPGDAEAEIAFDTGPDGRDEGSFGSAGLEDHRLHQDGSLGFCRLLRRRLAAGERDGDTENEYGQGCVHGIHLQPRSRSGWGACP